MDEGEIHDLLLVHCWFKSPSFNAESSNGSSVAGLRMYEGILRNISTHGGRNTKVCGAGRLDENIIIFYLVVSDGSEVLYNHFVIMETESNIIFLK